MKVYCNGDFIDETWAPIGELLREWRDSWCEDANEDGSFGPLCVVIQCDDHTGAVLMRDANDPELCHTMMCDGSRETHRCRYVLADGRYDHTEVTEVEPAYGD